MVDQCSVCEKPRNEHSEYCSVHEAAKTNLEAEYANWFRAFSGAISKEEYFSRLLDLEETGEAVKRLILRSQANAVPQ